MNQTHIAAAIAVQSGAPKMMLGMNTTGLSSYTGAFQFANLMYTATLERASGTGAWVHDHGLITTTDQNDIFRFKLADNEYLLPAGDYTVLNPSGLSIAVGTWGAPAVGEFTTATTLTFTVSSSPGVIAKAFS